MYLGEAILNFRENTLFNYHNLNFTAKYVFRIGGLHIKQH